MVKGARVQGFLQRVLGWGGVLIVDPCVFFII